MKELVCSLFYLACNEAFVWKMVNILLNFVGKSEID